jgi:hypothetical protein
MRELVYLKPPFDNYNNSRIIEVFKKNLTRMYLEVNVYLTSKTIILCKYDIKSAR